MKKLVLTLLCTLLLTPFSLSRAEPPRYEFKITVGDESLTRLVKVNANQELVVTVMNARESANSLSYTVYEVTTDTFENGKQIEHSHLAAGTGTGMKPRVSPGYYRVVISCPTKDCIGEGSIVIKDKIKKGTSAIVNSNQNSHTTTTSSSSTLRHRISSSPQFYDY